MEEANQSSQIHNPQGQDNLDLSPWRSVTTTDDFWDRNMSEISQFPIEAPTTGASIAENFSPPRGPPPVRSFPTAASQLRLSRPRTTSTITRPVDSTPVTTTVTSVSGHFSETMPSGVRSDSFSRSRWPFSYGFMPNSGFPGGFPPYDSFPAPPVWPGFDTRNRQAVPSDSSTSQEIKTLTTSISKFQALVNAQFLTLGNRLSKLENKEVVATPVSEHSEHEDSDQEDGLSLAPKSPERDFLSDDGQISSSPVVSRKTQPSRTTADPPPSVHSLGSVQNDIEQPGTDSLKSRVYSIRREFSDVPMASPPRKTVTPSDFRSCSGMVKDDPKGFQSFPESGQFKTALDFVNESIAESQSGNSGSKFLGFGPSAFPGKFRSKDYEIHNASLGRTVPVCDKVYSNLLGARPDDGVSLNKTVWSKSENNLRLHLSVIQTAEHFLAAAGSLLKDKGDEFSELRSLLSEVDQSLGVSHLLTLGTLANFTLAKRQDTLDKSRLSDAVKDQLLFSPLDKDKLFGVPQDKLLEEVSKAPPTVKVDVKVSDGKRKVTTTQSQSSSGYSNSGRGFGRLGQGQGHGQGQRKRPSDPKSSSSSSFGKKSKVVKGKKQSS